MNKLLCESIKYMITWPVIIKYFGEDELTFIENEHDWLIDPDHHFHTYTEGDQIVDSNGERYDLPYNNIEKMVEINKTDMPITLSEFEDLVKNHMVSLNQCCSSKIKLPSFKDGMLLVEKTNE